jgi:hypothetical protein
MTTSPETTLEVTGTRDIDIKTTTGWKKRFSITLVGMLNGATITMTVKADELDILEDIVPFNKKEQRLITIAPVNQTLTQSYPGAPGQTNFAPDDLDDELTEKDQDDELEELRQQLADAQEQTGPGE